MTSRSGEDGMALVAALLAALLLSSLGAGLALLTGTELRLAANSRYAGETLYAAEAAAERVLMELRQSTNWTEVLEGGAAASWRDSTRRPLLASRQTLDLDALTSDLQAAADATAPHRGNDPVWRLYAWGSVSAMISGGAQGNRTYAVVWVADDPGETDQAPLVDANGVLQVRAEAFGGGQTRRGVQLTVARRLGALAGERIRMLAWREVR